MKFGNVLNMFHIKSSSDAECKSSKALKMIVKPEIDGYNIPIRCKNIDSGVEYSSANAAAKAEGLARSSVQLMVNGKKESIKGIRIRPIL